MTHKVGCPVFEATSVIRWLGNHPWIMGVILLAFGLVTTFFGGKFFPWVLTFVASGLTFLIILLLCSVFGWLKALDKYREPNAG